MGFGDLFKSKKEREKEERKARRRAFRMAENAVDTVKDRIDSLEKERERSWSEARAKLRDGQEAAAQRHLKSCRASEVMMQRLEVKRWVFEQLVTKLELAQSDADLATALKELNHLIKVDPDDLADILSDTAELGEEQDEMEKIWAKEYEREMKGVEKRTDAIPSMEEMQKQLEDEVAADIGGTTGGEAKQDSLDERIGEGQAKLKKLLEDDK